MAARTCREHRTLARRAVLCAGQVVHERGRPRARCRRHRCARESCTLGPKTPDERPGRACTAPEIPGESARHERRGREAPGNRASPVRAARETPGERLTPAVRQALAVSDSNRGLTSGHGRGFGLTQGLTSGHGRGFGCQQGLASGHGRGFGCQQGLASGHGRGFGIVTGLTAELWRSLVSAGPARRPRHGFGVTPDTHARVSRRHCAAVTGAAEATPGRGNSSPIPGTSLSSSSPLPARRSATRPSGNTMLASVARSSSPSWAWTRAACPASSR
jgi:hypothetical protein